MEFASAYPSTSNSSWDLVLIEPEFPTLARLPDATLRVIAHMLLKRLDVLHLMLTCRRIHSAIASVLYWYPRLWTRRKLISFKEQVSQDRSVLPMIRKLRIDVPLVPVGVDSEEELGGRGDGGISDSDLAEEIICLCHSRLELLTINPDKWSKTIRCCDNLRTLNIFLAVLQIDLGKEIGFLTNLKVLGIEFYHDRQLLNLDNFKSSNLQELRLDLRDKGHGVLASSKLIKGCPNLQILNFRSAHSSQVLHSISDALSYTPNLQRLLFRTDDLPTTNNSTTTVIATDNRPDPDVSEFFHKIFKKCPLITELYVPTELLRQTQLVHNLIPTVQTLGLFISSVADILATNLIISSPPLRPFLKVLKITTHPQFRDGSWISASISGIPDLCSLHNIVFYNQGRSENIPQMSWFI